jgi:hypothetical protein
VVAVWAAAAIGAVVVLVTADPSLRLRLWPLVLAGAMLVSFAIQLATGEKVGFVQRLTASALGAFGICAVAWLLGVLLP